MTEEENMEIEQRLPYGGLFGASNLIKVIEQMIIEKIYSVDLLSVCHFR